MGQMNSVYNSGQIIHFLLEEEIEKREKVLLQTKAPAYYHSALIALYSYFALLAVICALWIIHAVADSNYLFHDNV
jgi:hypothetical protein